MIRVMIRVKIRVRIRNKIRVRIRVKISVRIRVKVIVRVRARVRVSVFRLQFTGTLKKFPYYFVAIKYAGKCKLKKGYCRVSFKLTWENNLAFP